SPLRSSFDSVASFAAPDPTTFKVRSKEKNPLFIRKFILEIVPKHLLEDQDLHTSPFYEKPIGSGPFRFVSWDKESNEIELAANDDYHEGRPYLNTVIIKTYQDNGRLWSALMRQDVDIVKFIRWEDYKVLEKDATFNTYKIPWEAYYAIAYDLSDPILSNISVRRAIAHAI